MQLFYTAPDATVLFASTLFTRKTSTTVCQARAGSLLRSSLTPLVTSEECADTTYIRSTAVLREDFAGSAGAASEGPGSAGEADCW